MKGFTEHSSHLIDDGVLTVGVNAMSPRKLEKRRPSEAAAPPRAVARGIRRGGLAAVLTLPCVVALWAAPSPAANFRGLGTTSSYEKPTLQRMNANGDQIVGTLSPLPVGALGEVATTWNEATLGFELVGPPTAPYSKTVATGQETSTDGLKRRTIGWAQNASTSQYDMWLREEDASTSSDTTTVLPAYPSPTASTQGTDISRHGHILGRYVDGPVVSDFFYDAGTGTHTDLVDLSATDMDAEGTRVVGIGTANPPFVDAVVWEAATGTQQILGPLPGGVSAAAKGISASGRIIVGSSESSNVVSGSPPREAFRWHPDFGMHALEPIDASESRNSEALATSDANVVVGYYVGPGTSGNLAFIWTPETGRVDLKSFLSTTYGLLPELFFWTLTSANAISADGTIIAGSGINPEGEAEDWVVDLSDEDLAEIRLRPVEPPISWELYLQCGDDAIKELFFAIIPPSPFLYDGSFDFADCQDQTTAGGLSALACTGSSGIGPTVSESSYVVLPSDVSGEPFENVREATFYFGLEGNAGPNQNSLCQPGDDEALLGYFEIDVPFGNSELSLSALTSIVGIDGTGNEMPAEKFRLVRERIPGGANVHLRRSLGDVDGSQWMTSIEAPDPYSKFSFAIILPPSAGEVSFGGCTADLGFGTARGCEDDSQLGSDIDFAGVRTLGPDPNLVAYGLRPDALYVYVEGSAVGTGLLSQMNTPNNRARLGTFSFDDYVSTAPGFVPTISYEGIENFDAAWSGLTGSGEVTDWCDFNGIDLTNAVVYSSGPYGTGTDPDWDGDTIEDADDKCPYVYSFPDNDDGGTLEQTSGMTTLIEAGDLDNVGNECQCGDAQNDDTVVALDIEVLRGALSNPELAMAIPSPAREKCNSVGPVFSTINPATQLPYDCNPNDVFVLLKARAGLPPLIPAPLEFPSCPDVNTP